jgi:Icc-related predicted phosphoesterase
VLNLPQGDILVVAGDMTDTGSYEELSQVASFLSKEKPKFRSIITVAGNHDLTLDRDFYAKEGHKHHDPVLDFNKARSIFLDNKDITYLEDSGDKLDHLNIWGSPWIPPIGPWAFTANDLETENHYFGKIPLDTDILVTHTPPKDIMDVYPNKVYSEDPKTKEMTYKIQYEKMGSVGLMNRIKEVRPKVHVFGHIHYCAGWKEVDGTVYVNASIVNNDNQPVVKPKMVSLLLD